MFACVTVMRVLLGACPCRINQERRRETYTDLVAAEGAQVILGLLEPGPRAGKLLLEGRTRGHPCDFALLVSCTLSRRRARRLGQRRTQSLRLAHGCRARRTLHLRVSLTQSEGSERD